MEDEEDDHLHALHHHSHPHAQQPAALATAPHYNYANHHALSLTLPLHPPSTSPLSGNLQQQQQLQHHQHHHLQSLSSQPHANAPPFLTADGKNDNNHRVQPRDDCWSQDATITLIHAWGDRYLQLNRGNLKQQHWKDVADAVNTRLHGFKAPKTDVQCKNRLDTLKKKYKLEKNRISNGWGPSKWVFFEKLDELIGPSKKPNEPPSPVKPKQPDGEADRTIIIDPNNVAVDTISKSKQSPDMTDSCSHGFTNGAYEKNLKRKRSHDNPYKDLARAIVKFGEVYERIESAKQQQIMDLEKQRMAFAKDLELQKMRLFMQTQLELAKLKYEKHGNTEHYI